jgi:hypothetical protein
MALRDLEDDVLAKANLKFEIYNPPSKDGGN